MRGADQLQMSLATGTGRGGGWKKGARKWLMVDSSGDAKMDETGKQSIMLWTGLPARDLRILDPFLSYPSTILGREKAIVVNLEHIKAIITAQEVLLLNPEDPSVSPFITELRRRIRCHRQATKPQEEENSEGEPYTRIDAEAGTSQLLVDQGSQAKKDASKNLPFEFVALEACLESASSSLEHEALRFELEAHPAMEKLRSKISTLNLERVRQFKSRLVDITARVHKVRLQLEHLLDDDEDMAKMYLTVKLAHKLEHSSTSPVNSSGSLEVDLPEGRLPLEFASEDNGDESYLQPNSCGTPTSSSRNELRKKIDVKQLQMILEAYFVQIDGSLNKLSTLMEYVDGTEDYIKIMLDDTQNNILQMGVKVATINLMMNAFIAVAGVFGMNITIELFTDEKAGPAKFLWTVIGGSLGSVFLYFVFIGWCKSKRWLR